MYIQCTQKLLDKLEQPYEELATPTAPAYCWHAHFFTYRRLFYVFLVNDLDGEDFFIEVESFEDFDKEVEEGIRSDLKDGGVPAKEITRYLKHGGPVTFGPITDRSKRGRVMAETKKFKDSFMATEKTMAGMAKMGKGIMTLSGLVALDREFAIHTNKTILTSAQGVSKPSSTPMVALNVELLLTGGKKVERSFLVPLYMNFLSLSTILNIGFGWTGAHPHEFTCNKGKEIIDLDLRDYFRGEELNYGQRKELFREHGALLADYIPPMRRIDYEYDFGDRWKHVIRVGRTKLVTGGAYAECTGGEGTAPPEDSGGPIGYAYKCEILSDPTHALYEETLMWSSDEKESLFDLENINTRLGKLEFTTDPI